MNLKPEQIFDLLDEVYKVMDECCARHSLYKVETIGDAYVVVAGLDLDGSQNKDVIHPCLKQVLDFALDVNQKL